MKNQEDRQEIENIEQIIGKILRIGVGLSLIFLLMGIFLLFINRDKNLKIYNYPRNLVAIGQGLVSGQPIAYLLLGLFILILTPILRVIASIFSFAKEKDILYVIITSVVLIILLIALIVSKKI